MTQNVWFVSGVVVAATIGRSNAADDLRQSLPDVSDDQWTLDERIVRDDVNRTDALAARERKQMLHHEMRYERAVLAAGEADDPELPVRLRVLVGNLPPDRVERIFCHKLHCVSTCRVDEGVYPLPEAG